MTLSPHDFYPLSEFQVLSLKKGACLQRRGRKAQVRGEAVGQVLIVEGGGGDHNG